MKYNTILIDPPWKQSMAGQYDSTRHSRAASLPYPTLDLNTIYALPIERLAEVRCHLWLWTTNQFIHAGFHALQAWGFTYLAPVHWIKPSGLGNYFIHRSQTLLFGYYQKCHFTQARYIANLIEASARRHSQKPSVSYELIEAVSPGPRVELFAREARAGWDVWGNEVENTIEWGIK